MVNPDFDSSFAKYDCQINFTLKPITEGYFGFLSKYFGNPLNPQKSYKRLIQVKLYYNDDRNVMVHFVGRFLFALPPTHLVC